MTDLFEQTINEDLWAEATRSTTPRSGEFAAKVRRVKWGTFPDSFRDIGGKPRAYTTFELYDKDGEIVGENSFDVTPAELRTKNGKLALLSQTFYLLATAAGLKRGTDEGTLIDAWTEKVPGNGVVYLWGKEQVRCTVDDLPLDDKERALDNGDKPSKEVFFDINDDNREWFVDKGFATEWKAFRAREYTGRLFRNEPDEDDVKDLVDELEELPF